MSKLVKSKDARGVTNIYVEFLCSTYLKHFKGVYPCDLLSHVNLKPKESIIVNLSRSSEPGSHFVALCQMENYCLYFDPYGMKCFNLDLLKYFKDRSIDTIFYSARQLQPFLISYFCSYYCISALICFEKNLSLHHFQEMFSSDLGKNDWICVDIIKSHIKSLQ